MKATVTIIPPIKEMLERIKAVIDDPDARRRTLTRAVLELKDRAAAYPPEGPWNREPGTGKWGWYQRQFGPRRRRLDGTVWGKNTSERLQKSWRTSIQSKDQYTAEVYTGVTYAPYLMDPEQQVHWASAHGWQTVDEIADGYEERFTELILEEVDNQIDKI